MKDNLFYGLVILFCFLILVGVVISPTQETHTVNVEKILAGEPDFRLDINSASAELLMLLPGVGEKTAHKIVDYRKKKGRISALSELENIKGIGKKTVERIAPYVRER
jgi:competence protein ComEA